MPMNSTAASSHMQWTETAGYLQVMDMDHHNESALGPQELAVCASVSWKGAATWLHGTERTQATEQEGKEGFILLTEGILYSWEMTSLIVIPL